MEVAQSEAEQAARRVYGVLATSLNEALDEVRQALAPHANLLPEGRLADFDRLLKEFEDRRVRIAIYGEVKAGKSTLLNAISGAELSPAAFDPLTSVPVRVTYGEQTSWHVGDHMFETVPELARAMRDGVGGSEVEVRTNLDLLRLGGQVDLLDTPGVGSEDEFDQISANALRSLDAVVLVVRYPALFTKFTRQLMTGLESDIGKLFVVWNLDADCAELSQEERDRHAATLRDNVAGAHELHLVDARAGFRAGLAGDPAAQAQSGLKEFTQALAAFASSDKRQVTALREAAKRARGWLEEATQTLTARRDELDADLAAARRRLEAVQQKAADEQRAAEERFEALCVALDGVGSERAEEAARNATVLRKRLRRARRHWIRSGDLGVLESALADATRAYADATDGLSGKVAERAAEHARQFGASVTSPGWARREPSAAPLAPEDRQTSAVNGSFRMLRRALWRRWYLPGVTRLEQEGISADEASQSEWFTEVRAAAEKAGRAVLDGRLEEIRSRAASELDAIKAETDFDARQAEFDALSRHVPIVTERREGVEKLNREARDLTD